VRFDHGCRGSNVARIISAAGFSLAGARQTVAEHGGTISLKSQLDYAQQQLCAYHRRL
jgi:hypothetical protein